MDIPNIQKTPIEPGARVLLRASLNIPIKDGQVASAYRLQQTARTIRFLQDQRARVVVIGHLGREGKSLEPVYKKLKTMVDISFVPSVVGGESHAAKDRLQPSEALLLENTRSNPGEEKNDVLFAEELAFGMDMFVFDDFSAAHRSHASTVGVASQLPSYAGIGVYEEMTGLLRITDRLEKPAIALVGGAKGETKIPFIKQLLENYEKVFVTGMLANTILKQKGLSVGASRTEDVTIEGSLLYNPNVLLPTDVLVTDPSGEVRNVALSRVTADDVIVDIGEETVNAIVAAIGGAKTVLMNGPTGWYEKGFFQNVLRISDAVRASLAYALIGGGDTVTVLDQKNRISDWNFVSTGGGALLSYIAGETFPVIDILKEQHKQRGGA